MREATLEIDTKTNIHTQEEKINAEIPEIEEVVKKSNPFQKK